MHGSLQFFAFWVLSLFLFNFFDVLLTLGLLRLSDSRVPRVAFRSDFGVREHFIVFFAKFWVLEGARTPFRTPSGIQGRKRAGKNEKGCQMDAYLN